MTGFQHNGWGGLDYYTYRGSNPPEEWTDPVLRDCCGTDRGYQVHRRRREYACDGCLRARRAYQNARARRGKCKKGIGWPL